MKEKPMASINELTPDQRQRALMLFYDLVPAEFWEGGVKPPLAEIEAFAEELQDAAPQDIKPVIGGLRDPGSETLKGETANVILEEFSRQEALRPYVDQAVAKALEPHMAPLPVIIGAVILVLVVWPREIKVEQDKKIIKFGHLKEAAEVIKNLPAEWLKTLMGKM
jgi:hypothetical protein